MGSQPPAAGSVPGGAFVSGRLFKPGNLGLVDAVKHAMNRTLRVFVAASAAVAIAVLSLPFGRDRGWSPPPPRPVTQAQLAAAAEQTCPGRLPECAGFHFDPPPPASVITTPGDHTPTVLKRRVVITTVAGLGAWVAFAGVLFLRRKRKGQRDDADPPSVSAPPIAELVAPASRRRPTIR